MGREGDAEESVEIPGKNQAVMSLPKDSFIG